MVESVESGLFTALKTHHVSKGILPVEIVLHVYVLC